MIRTDGATWLEFYSDKEYWENMTHGDETFRINGNATDGADSVYDHEIRPTDIIDVEHGEVFSRYWNIHNRGGSSVLCTLEEFFQTWLDKRSIRTMVIRVLPDQIQEFFNRISWSQDVKVHSPVEMVLQMTSSSEYEQAFVDSVLSEIKGVEILSKKEGEDS